MVLVLLVAGGGTAIALTRGDGDGDAKKEEKTSEPSGDQSATDPAPPSDSGNIEPTDPLSSSDAGPDGPAAPGDGVPTEKWRGSPRASEYRDDWEFKWEGNVYNARAVVARDHADCAEIATDTQLDDIGCARAVTATYVNERDKVTITHFFLRMDTRAAARKVEKRKDADTLLTIDGDAVWQDWEKGGWRISRVKRIVVLTAVTAPKNADEDKVQDYLRWAHQDFALAMRIRKNDF
ncbi:hypothetical protein [Nocardioides alcanivorans]|uniref:hypothetical protein n=1 Tax=Nocardioides alcanivorans TaxID=2897352 RepID=UPI001F1B5655|nr:hypothetical protein [Nocardioides alcanivorans]